MHHQLGIESVRVIVIGFDTLFIRYVPICFVIAIHTDQNSIFATEAVINLSCESCFSASCSAAETYHESFHKHFSPTFF